MTLKESLHLPDSTSLKERNSHKNTDRADSDRILEYFFTGERLLVFVMEQDGRIIETVSLPLTPETIDSRVEELLANVRANNVDGFTGVSRQLYNDLIAPVERYVLGGHSGPLVILPDGPLHKLPFAGLQNVRGDFLMEQTPIVYAPSRSVFQYCLASGSGLSSDGNSNVVLIDGTAGLPKGREEILFLEGLYSGDTITLGAKNLPEIKSVVAESEILHFSGHATSLRRIQEPVLMLQEFPETIYLDNSEIASWELTNSCLVNLAGCSTATGPIAAGEAPWGLIPAFLNAGTPAIMASLMQVDDDSTSLLTRLFYEQFKRGTDKATALQKAQLAMLDRSPDESKSLAWIPYILIGNPL
jgi:CHAT domain-containing protein